MVQKKFNIIYNTLLYKFILFFIKKGKKFYCIKLLNNIKKILYKLNVIKNYYIYILFENLIFNLIYPIISIKNKYITFNNLICSIFNYLIFLNNKTKISVNISNNILKFLNKKDIYNIININKIIKFYLLKHV